MTKPIARDSIYRRRRFEAETTVYDKYIKLLDQGTFDMQHLVPWLEEIAESA